MHHYTSTIREKADYELKLKSELEMVKVDAETIDSLKFENKKLVAELSELRKSRSTETQVPTVNEIELHRKTDDSQLKLSQVRISQAKLEIGIHGISYPVLLAVYRISTTSS